MVHYLYTLSTAILLAICLVYLIIKISNNLKVFDAADRHRKNHELTISRLGGIGVFLTFQVVVRLLTDGSNLELDGILSASVILFVLGLKDDLLGNARPMEKILMQLLAVATILLSGDYEIPIAFLPASSYGLNQLIYLIVMGLFMLFVINSFNLIDGVDGLAGVIGVVVNLFLAIQLFVIDRKDYALMGIIFSGVLIGFLRFNLLEKRIFLGDSGAMLTGLMSVVLGVQFIQGSVNSYQSCISSPFALVVGLLIVPIFDSCRILLIRYFHGKSLFKGDRNHIHHRLIELGYTDFQVVLVLAAFTLIIASFVLCFQDWGDCHLIVAVLVIAAGGNFLLSYVRRRRLSGNHSLKDVILKDTFNIR